MNNELGWIAVLFLILFGQPFLALILAFLIISC